MMYNDIALLLGFLSVSLPLNSSYSICLELIYYPMSGLVFDFTGVKHLHDTFKICFIPVG